MDEFGWLTCIDNPTGLDKQHQPEIQTKRNGRILLSGTWTEKECAKTAVMENVKKLLSSMRLSAHSQRHKRQIIKTIIRQSNMPHHEAEAWFNAVCKIHNQDVRKIAEAVSEL